MLANEKTIKQVTRHTIANSTIQKYITCKKENKTNTLSATKQDNVNITIHGQPDASAQKETNTNLEKTNL